MTTPSPDWAALYRTYRNPMRAMAITILRPAGRVDLVDDVVMQTMQSLMEKDPPPDMRNPEAYLVRAVQFKTKDMLKLHDVARRSGIELQDGHLPPIPSFESDAVERLDRQRLAKRVLAEVATLSDLERCIIWEIIVKERRAKEVAAEQNLSEARVSQIRKAVLASLRDRLRKGPVA